MSAAFATCACAAVVKAGEGEENGTEGGGGEGWKWAEWGARAEGSDWRESAAWGPTDEAGLSWDGRFRGSDRIERCELWVEGG